MDSLIEESVNRMRLGITNLLSSVPLTNAATSHVLGLNNGIDSFKDQLTWRLRNVLGLKRNDIVNEYNPKSMVCVEGGQLTLPEDSETVDQYRKETFISSYKCINEEILEQSRIVVKLVEQQPGHTIRECNIKHLLRTGEYESSLSGDKTHQYLHANIAARAAYFGCLVPSKNGRVKLWSLGPNGVPADINEMINEANITSTIFRKTYASKCEAMAASILTELGYTFLSQVSFPWCKSKSSRRLPFDFQVFTKNGFTLLEIDGRQHTELVKHFHKNIEGFEHRKLLDGIKTTSCENEGVALKRIKNADTMSRIVMRAKLIKKLACDSL